MMQRTTATLILFSLAACQGTHTGDEALAQWRTELGETQAELRREMHDLRASLDARDEDVARPRSAGFGSPSASPSDLGSSVGMAWPSDLGSSVGMAGPAAFSDSPAIEPLRAALAHLERQHALHCANIANVETPGYKCRSLDAFSSPNDAHGLSSIVSTLTELDMRPGTIERTGGRFDLAIQGEGFFEVALPSGEMSYTRNGLFRTDADGRLVTPEGYQLTDGVAIPSDSLGICISTAGEVFSLGPNNQLSPAGTIRVHTFANPGGLEPVAGSRFVAGALSGDAEARLAASEPAGSILQGCRESSNVDLTSELIALQRIERRAAVVRQALARLGVSVE